MRVEGDALKRRGIGLTPLIDVVFLLLLFFMLASTFARFSGVEVAIGGDGPPAATDTRTILLGVSGEGSYLVDGGATPEGEVAATLRERAEGQDSRIVIRAAGEATTQDIVRALEIASGAGAADVVLAR